MALIVEDGSGITGANSYDTLANIRAYATARGVTLPSDDSLLEPMVVQAMDYLESLRCEYQGEKTDCNYALEWPRSGVIYCCNELDSNVIPKELKAALATLTIAVSTGINLFPNVVVKPQEYVIEEKVGPISTKYADPEKVSTVVRITGADALLAPLFAQCGQGFSLKTVRV